ncbi:MAG: TIGR03086 family protein [Actinobacteria bacterium]|nr:TIGR03086 family protein [Actinomycetota bacterium]
MESNDSIATMRRVVDETSRVVHNVTPDQHDLPTACDDWTVRDVMNHITGGGKLFATCAERGAIPDDELVSLLTDDQLGDDPAASFGASANAAFEAFSDPAALAKTISLPFGQMPGAAALDLAIFDLTVHALDIARATGQPTDLDPAVLEPAYVLAQTMIADEMRNEEGNPFGFATEVPDDAPLQDKLHALAGRTV